MMRFYGIRKATLPLFAAALLAVASGSLQASRWTAQASSQQDFSSDRWTGSSAS